MPYRLSTGTDGLECPKRLACRVDGAVEVVLRMGDTHEAGFKLTRGDVHPLIEEQTEELAKGGRVALRRISETVHRTLLKIGAEHAADPLPAGRQLAFAGRVKQPLFQIGTLCLD